MAGKLVKTEKSSRGGYIYHFECIGCGREFLRRQNHERINPYCGYCKSRIDKAKAKEQQKKRMQKHDAQIREEALKEFAIWFSEMLKVDEALREHTEDRWIEDFERWIKKGGKE